MSERSSALPDLQMPCSPVRSDHWRKAWELARESTQLSTRHRGLMAPIG